MIKKLFAQLAVVGVASLSLLGLGAVASLLSGNPELGASAPVSELTDSTSALATAEGALASTQLELDRAHQILEFSSRYRIPGDMAARIYDHAVNEGIPPALGFQLVKIESGFTNSARSYASAIGLTQLMLPTARAYEPTVSPADLMNPDVNLRIGFRYLKDLLKQYDNDLALALEAYNKGPTLVNAQILGGVDVKGKYSRAVMGGMRRG
jgi:soluble lytic murein transglycosylase-like protein